jgi:hypothetical protein
LKILSALLTLCERRTLSNLTLSYNNVIYQIKTKQPTYTMCGAHVEVREKSNGEITIEYKQRQLEYTITANKNSNKEVIEAKAWSRAAVASLKVLRLFGELDVSQTTSWRTLHSAQVER